jgi:hypothetical protein
MKQTNLVGGGGLVWIVAGRVFRASGHGVPTNSRDERAEKRERSRARWARQACLRKTNQDRTPIQKFSLHIRGLRCE